MWKYWEEPSLGILSAPVHVEGVSTLSSETALISRCCKAWVLQVQSTVLKAVVSVAWLTLWCACFLLQQIISVSLLVSQVNTEFYLSEACASFLTLYCILLDVSFLGEKPFSCPHCNRAFADRSNLRAHLQTHSDVKKYQCKNCSKTFSRMSLLHKHEESGCCVAHWVMQSMFTWTQCISPLLFQMISGNPKAFSLPLFSQKKPTAKQTKKETNNLQNQANKQSSGRT